MDPVDPTFVLPHIPEILGWSNEKLWVTEPALPPDVTMTPQVPRCPADVWQRKPLSDVHTVASQDVAPDLEPAVPGRG